MAIKKLKAFTMMELLVSMTLTGILVAFAFTGYSHVQKLFVNYAEQSRFISDYNQLNKALGILTGKAKRIELQEAKVIVFRNDSSKVLLDLGAPHILLKFPSHTDTFGMEAKEIGIKQFQTGDLPPFPLVTGFGCEVIFQSRKFHVSFSKQYDGTAILNSTLEQLPPDEQP